MSQRFRDALHKICIAVVHLWFFALNEREGNHVEMYVYNDHLDTTALHGNERVAVCLTIQQRVGDSLEWVDK